MYKKLIMVILSVITIHVAEAQTEKGSQNLGATLGVSITNANTKDVNPIDNSLTTISNGKINSYSISASYSYFIANKLDIGAALGYAFDKETDNLSISQQTMERTLNYSANIFLRKYFLFNDKIGVRTGPYLDYQISKQRYTYTSGVSETNFNSDSYGGGKHGFCLLPCQKHRVSSLYS